MPRTPRMRPLALSTQAMLALALLLTLVVLVSLAGSIALLHRDVQKQYEYRALAIARSVAAMPGLANEVTSTRPDPDGPVQREAEQVRRATGALYVVVTDGHGTRYSHPTRANVGKRVSTSPAKALSGRDVVAVQKGTLGYSARGKVPLRGADGHVVGEVSVGISTSESGAETSKLVWFFVMVAAATLAIGLIGAISLARRLRSKTLGLEPEEMADLLREHAAVLGGVLDAVIAVDNNGQVSVTNPEAARLLGQDLARGARIEQAGDEIRDLFTEQPAPAGALRVIGDKVLLATRLPVRRDDRDLGQVLILRDRSDLDHLARELEATRALTDALRAQAHEHTNRLHALTGLLHGGHVEEAQGYLVELSEANTWVSGVEDPYLAGLLAAKSAAASEAGVRLVIAHETWVDGRLNHPLDVVSVVGNLIDNGVRAASDGDRQPAWVEVTLLSDGTDFLVHVADSGRGVPAGLTGSLFQHGFTTRDSDCAGHGIGLAMSRHTARVHGGDVRLVDAGGAVHGAVFEARMIGVLTHPAAITGAEA